MITEDEYVAWLDSVGQRRPFGDRDHVGTANYIDDAARRRAADAMRTGQSVSLARPLEEGGLVEDLMGYIEVDVRTSEVHGSASGPYQNGPVNAGFDIQHVAAHGPRQTHLDSLNHCGFRGEWYSGFPVDDPDGPSVAHLARHRLFTRGVVADIPAVRGTEWVDPEAPVTGEDIDASLAAAGVEFAPGDALLLYMGRDRYELAGNEMDLRRGRPTPGAGSGAGPWLVEHNVSVLCWDFLDAVHPSEPRRQVHSLVWAAGLVLVDNCNVAAAVALTEQTGSHVGGLIVAPPPLPRATGCLVDPIFIQ